MDKAGEKGPAAGIPPWLFIALALLVYRLPQTADALRADIGDFMHIEESARVQLALDEIEDVTTLFPIDRIEIPAPGQRNNWLEERKQKEGKRRARLRDWLMGGACARFRDRAAHALAAVEHARYLSEDQKTAYRQLVQIKKESLISALEKLGDSELRELAVCDSRRNPPTMQKAQIIAYLLETDAERRDQLTATWGELEPNVLANLPSPKEAERRGKTSLAAWRSWMNLTLNRPAYLLDLGILLIPVLGLLTVILPQWRGWRLERRFGLREHAGEFPEIDAMQAFVARAAPRIELRVNLLRPGFAFVYPRSYRHPRLAILGGMYVLWRTDRHTAQSILLHEIEHVRHGDYLLVGYGSFFAKYLKWLIIGVLLLMGLIVLVGTVSSVASLGLHVRYLGKSFATQGLATLSGTVSVFFLLMTSIIVPLVGIWVAELNADYAVSREQALQLRFGPPGTRIHRVVGMLTHPPVRLRMWLVKKNDWKREVLRQMLFPLSFLLAVLMLFLMGFFAKLPTNGWSAETLTWLLSLCRDSLARKYWLFGAMAVLVLLWPCLSGYWEQLFAGERRRYRLCDGSRCIAALLLGMLAVAAWCL